MKKLNITKEAFEKSNYFKNKYGKLEYVSESGKLFKTNKGKILKFNESVEYDYPLVEDWIKRARTAVVDARVGLMNKRSKEILLDDAIECLDLLESAFNDSKNNLQGTKFHIDNFPGEQPTPDEQAVPQLNEGTESNPRFKCMEALDIDDIYENRAWYEITLENEDGDVRTKQIDVTEQDYWGNINTNNGTCYFPSGNEFDGIGWGNDEDGYEKIVHVTDMNTGRKVPIVKWANFIDSLTELFSDM